MEPIVKKKEGHFLSKFINKFLLLIIVLTQITFELYERNRHSGSGKEYSLRIGFSSGAHYKDVLDIHLDAEHCLKVAPRTNLIPHLSLEEVLAYHNSYLNLPNLESIEQQIEERKLYYVQEDNQ